ncbi:MAG: FG-GAP-like repeat-containing protein [Bacteroidota bacterium]
MKRRMSGKQKPAPKVKASQQVKTKVVSAAVAGIIAIAGILAVTKVEKTQSQTFSNVAIAGVGNAGADAAISGNKDGGFAWGDINADGYLDLVVNTESSSGTRILIANPIDPNNPFFEDQTTTLCNHCEQVVMERSAILVDLNHDGYLDMLRNTSYSGALLYLNRGPAENYQFGVGANHDPDLVINAASMHDGQVNSEGLIAADYDNDGWLDLIIENHNRGIDIYENPKDGTANFTCLDPSTVGFASTTGDGDYSTGADFDNDGDIDLVARKTNWNDFYINNGDGTFTAKQDLANANNSDKGGVVFADFDNDGDFDLFWTNGGDNQIWVNNGVDTLTPTAVSTDGEPWSSAGVTAPTSGVDGCAVADVNNDGKLDLFLNANSGTGYLFINNTPNGGTLSFTQDNMSINVNANGEGCSFGDYDNDGDLDLYVNIKNGDNQLWRNSLNDNNYLYVEPRIDLGSGVWRAAIGANIVLEDCHGNEISGIRDVPTGSGHGTDAPDVVHFGLPDGPAQVYHVTVSFVTVNGTRKIITKEVTPSEVSGQKLVVYDTDTDGLDRCADWDLDGIRNTLDLDDDNDGIPDAYEFYLGDHDGDGTLDYGDPDYCAATFAGLGYDCSSGLLPDPSGDLDGDGSPNYADSDFPGCGGISEGVCANFDNDGDGQPNHLDLDSDNDGIPDLVELGGASTNGDGTAGCSVTGGIYTVSLTTTDDDGCTAVHTGTVMVGDVPSANFNPSGTASLDCPSQCRGISFMESSGQIVIEAENFDSNNQRTDNNDWEVLTSKSGYSGAGYMEVPDGTAFGIADFGTGAQLTYETKFTSTGTFYVFARVVADAGNDNSGYLGIDGAASSSTYDGSTFSNWTWVSMGTITVSTAGDKTIEFVRREDGFLVDKFVFSTSNTTPSGTGPAETPCTESGDVGPVSVISVTSNSGSGPYTVVFSGASSTDSDGTIVSYEWDFGDGTTGTGAAPSHSYTTTSQILNDSDQDGWCDTYDSFGSSYTSGTSISLTDTDGDGVMNHIDLDSDNDGISDVLEAGGTDANGDGIADNFTDSDADGLNDHHDPTDNDPTSSNDAIFTAASNAPLLLTNADTNGDGLADEGYTSGDSDNDGILDMADLDSDNDGIPDLIEVGGVDSDGDGRVDGANPDGTLTADIDGDGFSDSYDPDLNNDGDNNDPGDTGLPLMISSADTNGDGKPESYPTFDNDGNGSTPTVSGDTDGDGIPNYQDLDSDNDGIPDLVEIGGVDADGNGKIDGIDGTGKFNSGQDNDGDGFYDAYDPDDNTTSTDENETSAPRITTATSGSGTADGHPALADVGGQPSLNGSQNADQDGDGIPNYLDLDSDNDCIVDVVESGLSGSVTNGMLSVSGGNDTNGDGWNDGAAGNIFTVADNSGTEISSNTLPDYSTGAGNEDFDGDGQPNWLDIDSDNDGIVDNVEAQNTSGFVKPNTANADTDYDGVNEAYDEVSGFGGTGITPYLHTDGDASPDYLDTDSDNDTVSDYDEAWDGIDADDVADTDFSGACLSTDVDHDGLLDCFDAFTSGTSAMSSTGFYTPPADGDGSSSMTVDGVIPSSNFTPDFIFPTNLDQGAYNDQPDWRDNGVTFAVEWLNFSAYLKESDGVLEWATASENKSAYFEVQRSIDGIEFEPLDNVAATGTTSEVSRYTYTDVAVLDLNLRRVYYRLNEIDEEGKSSLSNMVELRVESKLNFKLRAFPNPTSDQVVISVLSPQQQDFSLKLSDVSGKTIWAKELFDVSGKQEVALQVSDWPAGIYLTDLSLTIF